MLRESSSDRPASVNTRRRTDGNVRISVGPILSDSRGLQVTQALPPSHSFFSTTGHGIARRPMYKVFCQSAEPLPRRRSHLRLHDFVSHGFRNFHVLGIIRDAARGPDACSSRNQLFKHMVWRLKMRLESSCRIGWFLTESSQADAYRVHPISAFALPAKRNPLDLGRIMSLITTQLIPQNFPANALQCACRFFLKLVAPKAKGYLSDPECLLFRGDSEKNTVVPKRSDL